MPLIALPNEGATTSYKGSLFPFSPSSALSEEASFFHIESVKFHLLYTAMRKKLRDLCEFFDEELKLPGCKQLFEDMELERARAEQYGERMFGLVTVSGNQEPKILLSVVQKVVSELDKVYVTRKSENSSFTILTYRKPNELRDKLRELFVDSHIFVNVRIKPCRNMNAKNL